MQSPFSDAAAGRERIYLQPAFGVVRKKGIVACSLVSCVTAATGVVIESVFSFGDEMIISWLYPRYAPDT